MIKERTQLDFEGGNASRKWEVILEKLPTHVLRAGLGTFADCLRQKSRDTTREI